MSLSIRSIESLKRAKKIQQERVNKAKGINESFIEELLLYSIKHTIRVAEKEAIKELQGGK